MSSHSLSRRSFLGAAAALSLHSRQQLAAADRKQFKIRDVLTMTLQGPSRTYLLVGKDPLEIDAIYTLLGEHVKDLSGTRTDGSAHT